jgi:hypothetical protein
VYVDLLKIKLYIFADYYQVSTLRTGMNREIVKEGNKENDCWAYNAVIIYAYKNLLSTDPILQFFVDLHYANWDPDDHEGDDAEFYTTLPREFLLSCIKQLGRSHVANIKSWNLNLCDYHGHTTAEEKNACRKTWRTVRKGHEVDEGF